ncbi:MULTISPECIES: MBL fold metallo-hydrolase [Streptomyces]|uniref:MBL fold metallo-hydrolase n=1 Tax=Streptomyces TaxID=1883 RepID=UPI00225A5EA0|nr:MULTISPECIES: MBL fold metallo-hydrolase [Streptomyces]MCX4435499.1 MBL fold metallo-hydrolase [Streptomyces mirabilis]
MPTDHLEACAGPGRVAASAGGLLVQRQGRCLLIDAGLGVADGDLGVAVSKSGALLDTLTALGHEPQDVEALAFTHPHTDHTGWGFVRDAGGKRAKTFPKARYLVTDAEWVTYGRDDIGLGAPSRTDFIEPLAAVRTAIDDGEDWRRRAPSVFAFHFGDQPFGRVTRDDSASAAGSRSPPKPYFPLHGRSPEAVHREVDRVPTTRRAPGTLGQGRRETPQTCRFPARGPSHPTPVPR